jgi:nicotinamide phosphoribosyltransferase
MSQFESILFDTDSYKVSMWKQYPAGTEYVYSYITARGGIYDKGVFFGAQSFIKEVLSKPVLREDVELAKVFWEAHGEPFNYDGWMHIVEKYNGYLPLMVKTLDEGLVVPVGTVLATVVNTDPQVPWLTTWVETAFLRAIWYGTTVATQSWSIKQVIKQYLVMSGDVGGLPFKLHDFGSRGVSSKESAVLGGMAHLVNFMGTDTAIAILGAARYYSADVKNTAFSIPAAEHSTITSWGRGNEALAYRNMVLRFSKEGSIYAVVSDSYDIFNAVENIWGKELANLVREKKGTLVIRPDSGDPVEVLPKLLTSLYKNFGGVKNDKGYIVLNNVRLIWGDGINERSIRSILRMVVDVMGFSADNIAFGMGGALLQIVNRDTMKFAMKASAALINGEWVDVFKDPITDAGKASMKGRFSVVIEDGQYKNVPMIQTGEGDQLKVRIVNGHPTNELSFAEVRANSEK